VQFWSVYAGTSLKSLRSITTNFEVQPQPKSHSIYMHRFARINILLHGRRHRLGQLLDHRLCYQSPSFRQRFPSKASKSPKEAAESALSALILSIWYILRNKGFGIQNGSSMPLALRDAGVSMLVALRFEH